MTHMTRLPATIAPAGKAASLRPAVCTALALPWVLPFAIAGAQAPAAAPAPPPPPAVSGQSMIAVPSDGGVSIEWSGPGMMFTGTDGEDMGFFPASAIGDAMPFGPGSRRMPELLRPDFQRRDLQRLSSTLGMDQAQATVIELLLEDYRTAFDAASADLRDALQRLRRRGGDPFTGHLGMLENADFLQVLGGDGDAPPMVIARGLPMGADGEVGAIAMAISPALDAAGGAGEAQGAAVSVDIAVAAPASGGPGAPAGQRMTFAVEQDGESIAISVTDGNGNSLLDPEDAARMIDDIRERTRRIRERLLARLQRESEDPATPEEVVELARALRTEKARLADRFQGDVRLILAESQRPDLERAFRAVRRDRNLPAGAISGERTDIDALARALETPWLDEVAAEEALADWETRLDALLHQRTAMLVDSEIARIEQMESPDEDDALARAKRLAEVRRAIRDLNDGAADALTHLLPAPQNDALRAEALRRGYPQIFRESQVIRLHDQALALPDLDDDLRSAIEARRDEYAARLDDSNDALLRITREHEPLAQVRMMEQMATVRAHMRDAARRAREAAEKIAAGIQADEEVIIGPRIRTAVPGAASFMESLPPLPGLEDSDPMIAALHARSAMAMEYRRGLENLIGSDRFASLPGASGMRRAPQAPGTAGAAAPGRAPVIIRRRID